MFSRPSNGSDNLARSDRPRARSPQRGIRNTNDSPVLFADSGIWSGSFPTLAADKKVRPASVLASLLVPFAGKSAEELAETLLVRFGAISRILSATDNQIIDACGRHGEVGHMIAGSRALVLAALKEVVTRSTVNPRDPNLKKYLALKFRDRPHEELHAIFVDSNVGFLAEELVSIGSVGSVEARISTIMRRAIELGAAGIFLVHNHPSSNPMASMEDIKATQQIVTVARALDVEILDHLIIAGNVVVSMRELGLL